MSWKRWTHVIIVFTLELRINDIIGNQIKDCCFSLLKNKLKFITFSVISLSLWAVNFTGYGYQFILKWIYSSDKDYGRFNHDTEIKCFQVFIRIMNWSKLNHHWKPESTRWQFPPIVGLFIGAHPRFCAWESNPGSLFL